jgi:hypothetical protein
MFSTEVMAETARLTNRLTNIPSANTTLNNPVLTRIATEIVPIASAESFFLVDMIAPRVRDEMMRGIQEMMHGNETGEGLMERAQAALDESRR